jgi:hypothetical protein
VSQYKGDRVIKPFNQPGDAGVEMFTWNRGGGQSIQKFWMGNWNETLARLGLLQRDWDSITIRREKGGMFRLDAAQSGDDYTEIHEVTGTNLMQSKLFSLVLKQKFVTAGVPAATALTIISKIANEVRKYQNQQQTYAEMQAAVAATVSSYSGAATLASSLMDDLDRNGEQFLQVQYVYTHTVSVAERVFQANAASFQGVYDNVERVHSESQVFNYENIPAEFYLPQRVLDGAPAEWLKQPPRAVLTSGQRRELTVTYLFADEWSRLYYLDAA